MSFDTGRSRDKLKINTELDKDEDVSAVPEEEEEEEKQSTSSDTGSKSTTLAKTTKLKSTKLKMSDSTKLIDNIQEQNRELLNSMKTAALLRLTMKISTDLNVHKTMHLFLQNIYVMLFYHDINLILKETA